MIDAATLAEVWDANHARLMLIARSIAGQSEVALEDAVQEAFVALARQQELPQDPLAWLVRVTRNRILQWHRGNERRQRREQFAADAAWFECGEREIQQHLDGEEVTRALRALASPEREIIVMHLWGDMTFDSIAKVIGGSRASAHRAFQRGLAVLQQQFADGTKTDSTKTNSIKIGR
ncbi:MAG: RNA polymerase sigma factor [Rubripirellula sp.]